MFNEVLLTISLVVLPAKIPLTIMEVPYRDLKSCSVASKDLRVKINKHLKDVKLNYKTECTRIGFNS